MRQILLQSDLVTDALVSADTLKSFSSKSCLRSKMRLECPMHCLQTSEKNAMELLEVAVQKWHTSLLGQD